MSSNNLKFEYKEHVPKGNLATFIDCIWWDTYTIQQTSPTVHHLIPDHTIELIFSSTILKRDYLNDRLLTLKSQLSGIRTTPHVCTVEQSPAIGVRFKPQNFYRFCKIEATHCVDNAHTISEIFGPSILDLDQQVLRANSTQERIKKIEAYFEKYIENQLSVQNASYENLVQEMERTKGMCSIGDLSVQFHISIKTIERLFKKHLGITPKKYCRLLRFRELVFKTKNEDILEHQLEHPRFDFVDQAHLIKEVKLLSGLTPKQLENFHLGIQEVLRKK